LILKWLSKDWRNSINLQWLKLKKTI
jgi:hypothetical protein